MFPKLTLLGVVFTIVGTDCEDSKPETIEIKGLPFTVEGGTFSVEDFPIPTLRRGAIEGIKEMERFWLTRCNITSIEPGAFQNLPNLRKIVINHNNLPRIEVGVFNHLNLSSLTLSENGIEYIAPHAFDNLTNLWEIGIYFNKLQRWDPNWFAKTPSLTWFFMFYNLFTEIPANAFANFNRRGEIDYISFDGNPIEKIDDDAFKNCGNISSLKITIKNTDVFSGNFLQATHFDKVEIKIDNVECLDEEDFSRIFVADSTKLTGNDLDYSCKRKIATWARYNRKTVTVSRW